MLKRTFTVLVAATALVVPGGAAVAAPPSGAELQDRLDAVHAAGMPGVFAEVRDDRRTWTPAAGVVDVETGRPVRDGLRHRVGSITKTFVATTLVQLASEGRVRLDAPIARYLSRDLVPAEVGRQVTVRQLLSHTSGIGNHTSVLLATPEGIRHAGQARYTPEELVRIGLGMPRTTGFAYSNTNYVLAGLIIEAVTGRPYEAEVTRRILRPLRLTGTYFQGDEPGIRGPHMRAYAPWLDGELRDFTRFRASFVGASGELISTAADLNVFYRALLTGAVLPPRWLAEMQRTVPMNPQAPEAGGYGLGLYSVTLPCGTFWGHDGSMIGHQTVSWHSPDGERQMTYAQSMSFYQTSPTEQHPIDAARAVFWLTALCGDEAGGGTGPGARTRSAADPNRVLVDR